MRFSILIPVHKTPFELMKRCINSLCNQKTHYGQPFSDFEVIIVFDGNCKEHKTLEEYFSSQYTGAKFITKEKGNVSQARNCALDSAQGDWILWCDSDDAYQPFALQELEDLIKKKGKEYDCFVYKANILNSTALNYAHTMVDNYVGDYEYKDLTTSNKDYFKVTEVLWRKCIKRKFLVDNNLRFNDQIVLYDDWYFHVMLCMKLNKAYKLDKALYNYYIREDSLSTKSEKENKRSYIYKIRDLIHEKLDKEPLVCGLSEIYRQRIDEYCDNFVKGI